MKPSALAAGLKAAAGRQSKPAPVLAAVRTAKRGPTQANTKTRTVLIGAHYEPEVRRTLMLVQAERDNTGKTLKQLLGEAINDLCVKYGKPQPYGGEE